MMVSGLAQSLLYKPHQRQTPRGALRGDRSDPGEHPRQMAIFEKVRSENKSLETFPSWLFSVSSHDVTQLTP